MTGAPHGILPESLNLTETRFQRGLLIYRRWQHLDVRSIIVFFRTVTGTSCINWLLYMDFIFVYYSPISCTHLIGVCGTWSVFITLWSAKWP